MIDYGKQVFLDDRLVSGSTGSRFLLYIYHTSRHLNCFVMASEKQKTMIRIDYQVLRESKSHDGHVDIRLVKKARRFFGRVAREEILRIMDPLLRVQAGEIAQRQVSPQSLHEIGQQAMLEAIKLYRVGQQEAFGEFAMIHARQAMVLARNKMSVPDPHAPGPELTPRQF
jgi:hypothetical protein